MLTSFLYKRYILQEYFFHFVQAFEPPDVLKRSEYGNITATLRLLRLLVKYSGELKQHMQEPFSQTPTKPWRSKTITYYIRPYFIFKLPKNRNLELVSTIIYHQWIEDRSTHCSLFLIDTTSKMFSCISECPNSQICKVIQYFYQCNTNISFAGIIPQLFARLNHPEKYVQTMVANLLCRIAKDSPQLIVYPTVVGCTDMMPQQQLSKSSAAGITGFFWQFETKLLLVRFC